MARLLILSSDTGEGHNSAAGAIRDASLQAGWRVTVRKPLEDSAAENRALSHLYNLLLTYRPGWVGPFARAVDRLKPNEADFCYQQARTYIRDFVQAENPDLILSVHPMLNHMIQRWTSEQDLGIPCCTFVTDPFPPFWKGWASRWVNRYFVVTEEAAAALVGDGVPPEAIERVSMPLRDGFRPRDAAEIAELRSRLAIDGETILVNGGARGGGPLGRMVRVIREAAPGVQVLVVCGRNRRARERLERAGDPKVRTYGFVDDIHTLVGAADLVITKPGALSTYESLASAVPAVLSAIGGLMPQESGLFHAAARHGFGFAVRTLEELGEVVRQGITVWRAKREAIARFYRPGASADLVERLHSGSGLTPRQVASLVATDGLEQDQLSHARG